MEQLDIRQLIGETTEYDKKQALEVKKPKSWCKSVSAFAKYEDKELVVLDVMPGKQTPYYYIGDGQMQAFMRVGNLSKTWT